MEYNFELSVRVDNQTGEVIAAYFQFRDGESTRIEAFAAGDVIADYDQHGRLLGIELLGPCELDLLAGITQEDARIRDFVENSMPYELGLIAAASGAAVGSA